MINCPYPTVFKPCILMKRPINQMIWTVYFLFRCCLKGRFFWTFLICFKFCRSVGSKTTTHQNWVDVNIFLELKVDFICIPTPSESRWAKCIYRVLLDKVLYWHQFGTGNRTITSQHHQEIRSQHVCVCMCVSSLLGHTGKPSHHLPHHVSHYLMYSMTSATCSAGRESLSEQGPVEVWWLQLDFSDCEKTNFPLRHY